MSTPDFVAALLEPEAYPHPCREIRLIETHISWVFLTGDYAYKVKKPVQFNFVDFSTLQLRTHYCEEEVRCNRSFAEELYLGVVTINRAEGGGYRVQGSGEVVEHAVRMREFPGDQQLDKLLAGGGLDVQAMHQFGLDLADQHGKLPRLDAGRVVEKVDDQVDVRVLKPVLDNFRTLRPLRASARHRDLLAGLEQDSQTAYQRLRPRFLQRLRDGFTRECHGDLHLSNLVLLDGRIRAFDCLEFNANLRWIDTASDVAFLLMDCAVRGRSDLGYAFLDGYLSRNADYEGAGLSVFFQVYRSMVRAKVAALQLEESAAGASEENLALAERLALHLHWAQDRLHRPTGSLVLMCGFSGSGKSYLGERLAPAFPAVRVRSDVLRKVNAGLAPESRSASAIDGGLYARDRTSAVYADMLAVSEQLVNAGEHVVVDATFLSRDSRAAFQALAQRLATGCVVVHCFAGQAILEERVRRREHDGKDASEAGLEVLRNQPSRFDAIDGDELTVEVDTGAEVDIGGLAAGIRAALS